MPGDKLPPFKFVTEEKKLPPFKFADATPIVEKAIVPAKKEVATKPAPEVKSTAIAEPSRLEEAWHTLKEEGIAPLYHQIVNKFTSPEKVAPIKVAYKPKEPIAAPITSPSEKITLANISQKRKELDDIEVKLKKESAVVPLGDTIHNYNGDKNRFIVPQRIQLDNTEVGVRSRGQEADIKTAGDVFSTYKKWRKPSEGNRFNFGSFLAYDKNENKVHVIAREEVDKLDSERYLVTGTYSHDIKEANLDGMFNGGIGSKTLGYVSPSGSKGSVNVFGVGNGNELGGYLGGKVILTTPDYKNPEIIYGSGNTIINEIARYKKEYGVNAVKLHEADGKSYAQMYQTKNRVITGATQKNMDNMNSSVAESGNFVYFK